MFGVVQAAKTILMHSVIVRPNYTLCNVWIAARSMQILIDLLAIVVPCSIKARSHVRKIRTQGLTLEIYQQYVHNDKLPEDPALC